MWPQPLPAVQQREWCPPCLSRTALLRGCPAAGDGAPGQADCAPLCAPRAPCPPRPPPLGCPAAGGGAPVQAGTEPGRGERGGDAAVQRAGGCCTAMAAWPAARCCAAMAAWSAASNKAYGMVQSVAIAVGPGGAVCHGLDVAAALQWCLPFGCARAGLLPAARTPCRLVSHGAPASAGVQPAVHESRGRPVHALLDPRPLSRLLLARFRPPAGRRGAEPAAASGGAAGARCGPGGRAAHAAHATPCVHVARRSTRRSCHGVPTRRSHARACPLAGRLSFGWCCHAEASASRRSARHPPPLPCPSARRLRPWTPPTRSATLTSCLPRRYRSAPR